MNSKEQISIMENDRCILKFPYNPEITNTQNSWIIRFAESCGLGFSLNIFYSVALVKRTMEYSTCLKVSQIKTINFSKSIKMLFWT